MNKYFKFEQPYYAIIKAPDEETAMVVYEEQVADIEGEIEMKEISRDYALITYAVALGIRTADTIGDIISQFENEFPDSVILVDSALC